MAKQATTKRTAAKKPAAITSITLPKLAKGELWAGIVLNAKGAPAHHLILLPGELESGDWKTSIEWAKKQGGELPTRQEQSILFGNLRSQFQSRTYWSGAQYAGSSGDAWCQSFYYGGQYGYHKDDTLRARAVRRTVIQ